MATTLAAYPSKRISGLPRASERHSISDGASILEDSTKTALFKAENRNHWDLVLKDGLTHEVWLTDQEEQELKAKYDCIGWKKKYK